MERGPEARGPMQLHQLHRFKVGPGCSKSVEGNELLQIMLVSAQQKC